MLERGLFVNKRLRRELAKLMSISMIVGSVGTNVYANLDISTEDLANDIVSLGDSTTGGGIVVEEGTEEEGTGEEGTEEEGAEEEVDTDTEDDIDEYFGVFSGTAYLDEDVNNWSLNASAEIVTNVEGANGNVLKVVAGSSSTSNTYDTSDVVGDKVTVSYRVKIEDSAVFDGGLKLYYKNEINSNTEAIRLKLEEDQIRYQYPKAEDSTATSNPYYSFTHNFADTAWHDVKLELTILSDGTVGGDIYVNDIKLTTVALDGLDDPLNADGKIAVSRLNFYTDSNSVGTFYYDNISIVAEDVLDVKRPSQK